MTNSGRAKRLARLKRLAWTRTSMDFRPRPRPRESPSTNCMNPPMHTSRPWVSSTSLAWDTSTRVSLCFSHTKPIFEDEPPNKDNKRHQEPRIDPCLSFSIASPCNFFQCRLFVRRCLGFPSCEGLNLPPSSPTARTANRPGRINGQHLPTNWTVYKWMKKKNVNQLFSF